MRDFRLLVPVVLLFAGCSNGLSGSPRGSTGAGSSGTTGTPQSVDAFCATAEPLLCQVLVHCGRLDPAADCSNFAFDCTGALGGAQATAPEWAAQCLQALQSAAPSGCDLALLDGNVCPIGPPGKPEGSHCEGNEDCIQRPDGGLVVCSWDCPRICTAGGTLGEPCAIAAENLCQQGFCDEWRSGTPTCEPFAELGEPCEGADHTPCSPDLACLYGADGGLICQPRSGAGGACRGSADCASGLFCKSNTCTAGIAKGGACNVSAGGQGDCAFPYSCVAGICADATDAKVGEPCDAYVGPGGGPGPYCWGNQACVAPSDGGIYGLCVALNPPGQPCVGGRCRFGTCDNGTCVAFNVVGQSCAGASDCRFGDFCFDGGCMLAASLGQPCLFGPENSCLFGFCSADAGTCQPLFPAGANCDPNQGECTGSLSCASFLDGGSACADFGCQVRNGGATPVCVTDVECP